MRGDAGAFRRAGEWARLNEVLLFCLTTVALSAGKSLPEDRKLRFHGRLRVKRMRDLVSFTVASCLDFYRAVSWLPDVP